MPDRVLVVDKPSGPTSRRVAERVAGALGARKAGHAGTLDPIATGVLVVCLDRATLISSYVAGGIKRYRVGALIGVATDTLDIAGEVVSRRKVGGVRSDAIESVLPGVTGRITQAAPAYSAVKHNGTPLHRYARRGLGVPVKEREVVVSAVDLVGVSDSEDGPVAELEVACGPGTYVRSLVARIGELLGTGACVAWLRRLESGRFSIDSAVRLEEIEEAPSRFESLLLTMEEATDDMAGVTVDAGTAVAASMGKPMRAGGLFAEVRDGPFRILGPDGTLIAIYGPPREEDGGEIAARALRVLRPYVQGENDEKA